MVDPVVTEDGHTYERTAILHWLKDHDTSPKTMTKLKNKLLVPNHVLRAQIIDFRQRNGLPEEKAWEPDPSTMNTSEPSQRGNQGSNNRNHRHHHHHHHRQRVVWNQQQRQQACSVVAQILQNNPHILFDTGLHTRMGIGVPYEELANMVISTPAMWNHVQRKFREHEIGRQLMHPIDQANRHMEQQRRAEEEQKQAALSLSPPLRALQDDINALGHRPIWNG